jgi:ABC-type transport system involved in multi-copper enzyme maturation permease subunit
MSWHGIRTVATLELRQRTRTSRWPIVLLIWVFVVMAVSFLAFYATSDPDLRSGESMYDIVIFFVLGLAMLIVPSLTATSVNGDREHGVLATLQTTLLTAWDLALGKLLAAWVTALTFLVTALPFLAWAWFIGSISWSRILLSLAVLILVLAVICAVGLMFSTLTARPVASAVLTYLTMGALVFGTTIAFGLSAFLVTAEEDVTVYGIPDSFYEQSLPFDPNDPSLTPEQQEEILKQNQQPTKADCVEFTRRTSVAHTERIWWLLPLNPFVVVADAAPSQPRDSRDEMYAAGFTPMRWISGGARMARNGPSDGRQDECAMQTAARPEDMSYEDPMTEALRTAPVWPVGLAFLIVAGAASAVVAGRRLHTPIKRLPNGTRIA